MSLRRQRPMVLVQLIHEPTIGRRGGTTRTHELERLRGQQAVHGDEVPAHDGDGAGRAHRAMDEDARLGARAERAGDVERRAGEVCGEFREGGVVQRHLRRVRQERLRERDAARHRGEHVRDAERGERARVLRGLQVRDVEAWEDLGDVRRGGRGCVRWEGWWWLWKVRVWVRV